MSNIQKAFKTKAKRGLCMAVGGVLDPAEQNSRAIAAPSARAAPAGRTAIRPASPVFHSVENFFP